MKLITNKCDCKDKKKYCLLLFRQLKLFCSNKKSLLYFAYGGKRIKCDFGSTSEIGYLYERDHVSEMNEPHLARIKGEDNFSRENCYFFDSVVTLKQLVKKVYGWEM